MPCALTAQNGAERVFSNVRQYYAQNGRTPYRANMSVRKANKKPACMTGKRKAGLLCPAPCVMLPIVDNGGYIV
jgi:hypothetical protein